MRSFVARISPRASDMKSAIHAAVERTGSATPVFADSSFDRCAACSMSQQHRQARRSLHSGASRNSGKRRRGGFRLRGGKAAASGPFLWVFSASTFRPWAAISSSSDVRQSAIFCCSARRRSANRATSENCSIVDVQRHPSRTACRCAAITVADVVCSRSSGRKKLDVSSVVP